MKEITITIYEGDDGIMYDIFDYIPDDMNSSIDGGCCTTNMENALGMAFDQAKKLINKK